MRGSQVVAAVLFAFGIPSARAAGKRGLGYPYDQSYNAAIFNNGKKEVSWAYNWEAWKPSGIPNSLEYIATVRVKEDGPNLANFMKTNGATTLFCLNEPDEVTQANMNVTAAVKFWLDYCEPFAKKGVKLIAPAVTNGGGSMGLNYLDLFLKQCKGRCTISGINLHWYGPTFAHFKSHILTAIKKYPQYRGKIYVTEFRPDTISRGFLRKAMSLLDNAPAIKLYAYFGAFTGSNTLVTTAGKLSDLGKIYMTY